MKTSFLIFFIVIFFGCVKNSTRKPINSKPSTTILTQTIKKSKLLNKLEEDAILAYIKKKDTRKLYIDSQNGFWYKYDKKIDEELPTPKMGDEVVLSYNISNLQDEEIYSHEVLGIKNYTVDKENFIAGLQKGIKLMKTGETITFVIPSYNAFGIAGDGNKIGINTTIKSKVTLININ